MLRAWSWSCVLGLGLVLGSGTAQAQFRGIRFEITQVGDTTFRFPRGNAGWIKPEMTGIAVDPRRRDILVAEFRVVRVAAEIYAPVGSLFRRFRTTFRLDRVPDRARDIAVVGPAANRIDLNGAAGSHVHRHDLCSTGLYVDDLCVRCRFAPFDVRRKRRVHAVLIRRQAVAAV